MATAAASMNTAAGTFMFHPRPTVFEHPITYDLPTLNNLPSATHKKYDADDLSQYYISEPLLFTYFFDFVFLRLNHHFIDVFLVLFK